MAKESEEKQPEIILINPYADIDAHNLPDVGDYVDPEQFIPVVLSALDHIGEVFGLLDYKDMEGDLGAYMLLTVYDYKTDDIVMISTGSMFVMPVIRTLFASNIPPCRFKFEKLGRSYKLVRAGK